MNGLRDARLRRALESAPDAHLRPDARTRAAILAAARGTGAPAAAPRPWWRALWDGTGRRGPWNAAFASLLVASLVTLIWQGHEVPDAQTEVASVASAPPPPAVQPAPAPLPADPPQPARPEPPAPQPLRKAVPRPESQAPSAADAVADAAAEQKTRQRQDLERREAPKPAPAALAEVTPPVVAAAPVAPVPPPAMAAQTGPPAAAPLARGAAAPAPSAPPAPASSVQEPDARASADGALGRDAESAAAVRLVLAGRSVSVPLPQARRLLDLAQTVGRSAQGNEPLAGPVSLRIEVPAPSAGVLEIAGAQVRWRGLTGRPEAADLQALEQEAARLAR